MTQVGAADETAKNMILVGFEHRVGRHCGSTSLQDVMNYAGWPLSEAACFGLASGLAYYFKPPSPDIPLGIFMGRCRQLENNFFENCGISFERRSFDSFTALETHIQAKLRLGRPVMLQGDLAGLPYYKSPMHFPGHKFVVCGYAGGMYTIADTAFPELQVVTAAELTNSTSYENAMWAGAFIAYDFEDNLPELTPASAARVVARAIAQQVNELAEAKEHFFLAGDEAHQAWFNHTTFATAPANPYLGLGARMFYQVIEKRGTGGGAFRGIYLDFIGELLRDQLFPFSVHEALFKSQSEAQRLLENLRICVSHSQQTLSRIAQVYKMLSIKKIPGIEAESQVRNHLSQLKQHEQDIITNLILLKEQCKEIII